MQVSDMLEEIVKRIQGRLGGSLPGIEAHRKAMPADRDPGHAENSPLPGGFKHNLTVDHRRCQCTGEFLSIAHSTATPIMASRVTISASASSERPSVEAGRMGSTR